eukprot:gnl/TRDRNA2_/TRDRNA2_119739_c1_seq1.p1 gnl/TRDRNA2_/TRDRNA2_119739_c1~~gnl/TRDRNA2_/TRDRNA2_119739_c1_seq1.p1  ORF type:complete len:108 (+),score=8.14 gnl/TRDRNA2_/TRDRNA2_119739_c1_seq1:36-326(+)
MNPEVMTLQRPLHHFDDSDSINILRIIREHIQNRGFCMPAELSHTRRPRTCFFSLEMPGHASEADVIWQIDPSQKTVTDASSSNLLSLSDRERALL